MKLSVVIKALNEERNITRAIESTLEAVRRAGGGELILADSLSTDRTVELANRYPIRIVQLDDPADRSCGAGAELGYRIAQGEYIYILDADMEFEPGFLAEAVGVLDSDARIAGVGGLIQEMHVVNAEFRRRAADDASHLDVGQVDRLNGGGLFRRAAIDKLGYLTNHNLHGFEEYELALRLRADGWRLIRLGRVAVKHYGHTDSTFRLLWRRWKQRYAWGAGELLRQCLGKPYFHEALKGVKQYRLSLIVLFWWIIVTATFAGGFFWPAIWWLCAVAFATPLLLGTLRKRSVMDGLYMVVSQNLYSAGVIAGFVAGARRDPSAPPGFRLIK